MKLNREMIISILTKKSVDLAIDGSLLRCIGEEDFIDIAEEILLAMKPKKEPPPQLHKHNVMCSHDWFLSPNTYSKYCPKCHSLKAYNPPKS